MSKVRIYIEKIEDKSNIEIKDSQIIHKIKNVLHMSFGEKIYLFDGKGAEFSAVIDKITKNSFIVKDIKKERFLEKPKFDLILGFPLLKEEKIDFILQKSTELGVSLFIPFFCKNSINKKPSGNKIKRWEKIILEATRQSDRLWLPKLLDINSFDEILRNAAEKKFVASKNGERIDRYLKNSFKSIFVVVGPEGDFTNDEYRLLEENGFKKVCLSDNILRTETAAIFAVGLLNYYLCNES